MPATEQTWRDQTRMHLIFGISSLAMLGTTIWMLAADHRREWKEYQRTFQRVEAWNAQARIDQTEDKEYYKAKEAAEQALQTARLTVPTPDAVEKFNAAVANTPTITDEKGNASKVPAPKTDSVDKAFDALIVAGNELRGNPESKTAQERVVERRQELIDTMQDFINDARFREEELNTRKKFLSADLDVVRSEFELGVGNELPKKTLNDYEAKVEAARNRVDDELLAVQAAKSYRLELERRLAAITDAEMLAKKQLEDVTGKVTQLEKTRKERDRNNFMKVVTEMPILDSFGTTVKIEQVWLPTLPINYNFGPLGNVARYDRCITCHTGIDKTAPGSASKPGYREQHRVTVKMQTPASRPEALGAKGAKVDGQLSEDEMNELLDEVYGIQLAKEGVFDANSAMISVIRPDRPAAKAQLEVGDVIKSIGGSSSVVFTKKQAFGYLLLTTNWGQPLEISVDRGVPHPFASHPRLDLFVGALSPHKMQDIGCTICHDGQGSATAFKWASHSPDNPSQSIQWQQEHGWFDNHHWIFPMYPKRFAESLCLKCHHEVVELEPSQRFPDPPAPKLVEGFRLIEQFGCFGCHEINGYDGPNRRIGPDLRTQPNTAAAAEALLYIGGLSDQQKNWANELVERPNNDTIRRGLLESLRSAEKLPGDPSVTKKIVTLLEDIETPGKLRKVGPSLRHVASKNDFEFLYSWIRQPNDFRPSTKMPRFFGLYDDITGVHATAKEKEKMNEAERNALHDTENYEPIEIRAISEFLLAKSQPFTYATPATGVQPASPERGKVLFETRGCLACHKHDDFPAGEQTQGPDLSRIGAKLSHKGTPDGEKWLYTWLKNPSSYHTRTLMPNLQLDPANDGSGRKTDPIADLVSFLAQSGKAWVPLNVPSRELTAAERTSLYDLALENLKAAVTTRQAQDFLKNGIPEDRRSELKGDEVELVGPMTDAKQLQYVGRRAISKYGCSGCHDIPGYEDAKPIGTGLADWGRKTADKLAFEQIAEYLKHGHGAPLPLRVPAGPSMTDVQLEEADVGAYGHTHIDPLKYPDDPGYFVQKLLHHQREGFIWQKLREPRSYDFKKVENKPYNDRLRMPQFTGLDERQREAIITFVLGLVAEPPPVQYVYKPTPRREAIVQGEQLIERFNCTGCHKFTMERWDIAYEPGDFGDPAPVADFAFLQARFTSKQVADSLETDIRGRRRATLVGMPVLDDKGIVQRLDDTGTPIDADDKSTPGFYLFTLYDNVLLNGKPWQAGLQNILVPESRIEKKYPSQGGFLVQYAFATVVAEERKANPNAKAEEAMGWLPPPLAGEGRKVQTPWVHDFLLDPHAIRPAAVLRMPKFNMSHDDATKLANYFAAVDGVGYPYEFDPRTRESYLAAAEAKHPNQLGDSLKIVTDNSYCVKCHLVGDYAPPGSDRAKAPRLDDVHNRLRPEWVLDWTANPKRILPYTPMPVNIPFDKPVSQELYKGNSVEQLNGVVDLLMNFDRYFESKANIKDSIKPPPAEGAPANQAAAGQ